MNGWLDEPQKVVYPRRFNLVFVIFVMENLSVSFLNRKLELHKTHSVLLQKSSTPLCFVVEKISIPASPGKIQITIENMNGFKNIPPKLNTGKVGRPSLKRRRN